MFSPSELIEITCVLRRKQEAPEAELLPRLTHQQLAEMHGADHADMEALEYFASERGFSIVKADPGARSVVIAGKRDELKAAFNSYMDERLSGYSGLR